tara:strand:+ start:12235 stop:13476 length:1242 start_codon:yes stop_codon:yes gene_type:complete
MKTMLLLVFFLSESLWALTPPTDVETTGTLPKGVFSPRFRQYYTEVSDRFANAGSIEPLSQGLKQQVKWQQVLNQFSGQKLLNAKSSLQAMGVDPLNGSPGNVDADLNVSMDIKAPVLAYGYNDRTSLAIVIPVYTVKTSLATSFLPNAQAKAWFAANPSPSQKQEIKNLADNAVATILSDYNYKPLESEDFTAVGDIYFVVKRQVYEDKQHSLLWKNYLVAPTGIAPDADKVVDIPTGDGQWDYQTGLVYQYDDPLARIGMPMTYSLNFMYNYQFADTIEKRIPEEAGSPLSREKETLDRKLGDEVWLSAGIEAGDSSDGSLFGFSYDYQYAFPVSYSGSAYESFRYRWLEELEGEAQLTSATFKYQYSTIGAFRRKKFDLPAKFMLSYAMPIDGKNTNKTEIYYGQITLYF